MRRIVSNEIACTMIVECSQVTATLILQKLPQQLPLVWQNLTESEKLEEKLESIKVFFFLVTMIN